MTNAADRPAAAEHPIGGNPIGVVEILVHDEPNAGVPLARLKATAVAMASAMDAARDD